MKKFVNITWLFVCKSLDWMQLDLDTHLKSPNCRDWIPQDIFIQLKFMMECHNFFILNKYFKIPMWDTHPKF